MYGWSRVVGGFLLSVRSLEDVLLGFSKNARHVMRFEKLT
jgi:hypothetical protein